MRAINRYLAAPMLTMSALVSPMAAAAQARPGPTFPLQIDSVRPVGAELASGLISDAKVSTSGRVCLADFSNQRIACFTSDGRLLWILGRKGEGPGEFRAVYRLALDASDTVYAFDIASSEISVISPGGKFLRRSALPIRFRQVDDVLAGPDRTLLISGIAPLAGQAADSAIHVFHLGDTLTYIRSFGLLPAARNSEVLAYWGAGGIRLLSQRRVVYGRRYPYEIYAYSTDGHLLQKVIGPAELRYGPDDAIQIRKDASSMHIADDTTKNIVTPLTPIAISDHFVLAGRRAKDGTVWWDAIPLSPRARATSFRFSPGQSLGAVIGVDRTHHLLWAVDNDGSDPCLVRMAYRLIVR